MTLEVRAPKDWPEMLAFEGLQRDVWKCPDREIVPAHQLQAHHHHGGCLLGLWQDGMAVGCCYAFPGPLGQDYLYSHFAAITPSLQGQGLGFLLKQAQADWARERGYRRIVWTYDPLQAANSRLNLGKLGAVCNRYRVDYYGELEDELNRGIPSDRLEVDWWLGPVQRFSPQQSLEFPCNLPWDERLHWRLQLRTQLQQAFAQGLAIVGFRIENGWGRYLLGDYLLEDGPGTPPSV